MEPSKVICLSGGYSQTPETPIGDSGEQLFTVAPF